MQMRISPRVLFAIAILFPAGRFALAQQAGGVGAVAPQRPEAPGDIYASAGFPCVAAHSTTRALYAAYNGPLYQVMRQSDGKTLDIGVVGPSASPTPDAGGYADAAAQDAFCAGSLCWISIVYDQSGHGNHLYQAPPGTFKGPAKGGFNTLPIADMAPITIGGHKAYGVCIMPGMGLRNNNAAGLAINDEPQGIYMVFDGAHYDSGCCFNYGNTSTNSRAVGRGTMDTVYFGTATAWGKGSGPGPWIMSDMEAGLFSGYNAGVNEGSPTIDSWRFVTGVVNGGGGNQWELRGGDAQAGELATFYRGERPGSRTNSNYFPMHRKGAVQLGNGGDNGNGSAGTFYEGVITSGYPNDAAVSAVHANIKAARYDAQLLELSRVTTFTPHSAQEMTVTFANTTGAEAEGVTLSLVLPAGWTAAASGGSETYQTFSKVAPGANVSATFRVTAPATPGGGVLSGKAEWKNQATAQTRVESIAQRIRNVFPIKINEVRLGANENSTNQFIELYNAGENEVDISDWSLINTRSEWAPVKLASIPAGTKLARGAFYLLGLSASGLAAPAHVGESTINVRSTDGFEPGQQIDVDGEIVTIASVGTAATPATTVFIPVSTGPWLTIPSGSTNLPVTDATGFEVGQKIGVDLGGNYEVATVTAVGKAATQTTLAAAATSGATNIKVAANANMTVGDTLTIGAGARKDVVKISKVGTPGASGTGVDLDVPLKHDQMVGVDVSDAGTGVSFSPATRFPHRSGDAVQALGGGVTLESALVREHEYGAAVVNSLVTSEGFQGPPAPNQWFGDALSSRAGSIALMNAGGDVVVDAIVYGSKQSSSSANGTIASPEIAVLEGEQGAGGCLVVAPSPSRRFGRPAPAAREPNKTVGRITDGGDSDSNCHDFVAQTATPAVANR
jgi:non-reducing end alpha-L-arabinofuranosidase